ALGLESGRCLFAQHVLNYVFGTLQLRHFLFAERYAKGFFYIVDQAINKRFVEAQVFDEISLLYLGGLIDTIVFECLYYGLYFNIIAHFIYRLRRAAHSLRRYTGVYAYS